MRYNEILESATLGGFSVTPLNVEGDDRGQETVDENTGPVTHRIGLTVTDPNHPMVSKRKEPYQKSVRITQNVPDREAAINQAIAHYRRKGYKVHDHHYMGTVDAEPMAEGPTDDPRFQKMMGNIQKSTPALVSGYVALNFASEQRSKKIKGVSQNGKPMPDVIDNPEEFLSGKIEFTPDQVEKQLTAIGKKYGWDSIDSGQGQGYTEMFFDTSKEYTSNNQNLLAANIANTVNAINKFFNGMNNSLQATGLPGYKTDVWQGMGPPNDTNQIGDLSQIANIAKGKSAKSDPGAAIGKMILKYIPSYEAENDELGYDPEDFASAMAIAKVYIAQGEKAGLQAQLKAQGHVGDMIDELLSDAGGSGLRTIWDLEEQGMAEGKKPDNYHIVNKDGKPASLASYADRASAEKDRDAKHPGAEVRQVGPRGKVKGVSEGLGYSTDPEQAKWYHEGRKAFKFGTRGSTIQDVARKHNCPPEWLDAFHAGYQDQEGWGKDPVDEALKLDAPQRKWSRDELHSYVDRIQTDTKTKADKFKPIIHGSNVKAITKSDNPDDKWDLDDLAQQIMQRPSKILGTNAKMAKSKEEGAMTYDLTLPALSGIVMDEETGDFVEIKTCPGAGECQLFCYARKGGYRMFPASSMSAAQALNFLVNDPAGYMAMFDKEVKMAQSRTSKAGIKLLVRIHDAGDFFSKDYYNLAMDVARNNPDAKFYFYTKMGEIATDSNAPPNVVGQFSGGAQSREVKKVEFQRGAGQHVKDAITLPKDMFRELFQTDAKGKYVKDEKGRTQVKGEAEWNQFKQQLASKYKLDADTIITYDQMLRIPEGPKPKWNVIVFPAGHGDLGASRLDVAHQFLMFH